MLVEIVLLYIGSAEGKEDRRYSQLAVYGLQLIASLVPIRPGPSQGGGAAANKFVDRGPLIPN